MKYRTHIQVILKSGKTVEAWSKQFESEDHEEVVSEVFDMRELMNDVIRKKVGDDNMNDGFIHVGSWQIDAMELAAFSMNLYEIDEDAWTPHNEIPVEVPMP